MTTFDDLQDAWNQQQVERPAPPAGELIKLAEKHTQTIKAKHWWTISILSVLIVVLVWFFGYATHFTISRASAGLLCMIFSMLLRVLLEYASYISFSRIAISNSFKDYTRQITRFYTRRKTIHYICTPVILLAYMIGFILLLPAFKQNMSAGFYLYTVVSGTVFFLFFGWFISKQVIKELLLLDFLKKIEEPEESVQ